MAVEFVDTAALARLLKILPQSVRRWRMTGAGPRFVRLGGPKGRVVYELDEVKAWIQARTFTSTAAETVARS